MNDIKTPVRRAAAYEADFYAWSQDQAARLRELQPSSIDWGNVAEEIESLGRSDKRAIESDLAVVLLHLLKWRCQPKKRKPGWQSSVTEHRWRIARLLRESPSLRNYPKEVLAGEYYIARLKAVGETKTDPEVFPLACPFTVDQILDPDFWPEAAEG